MRERIAFEREVRLLGGLDRNSEGPVREREFVVEKLPPTVKALLLKGPQAWLDTLEEAIKRGIRDADRLASLLFFARNAAKIVGGKGAPIARGDKDFVKLRAEWKLYRAIATSRLSSDGKPKCALFLPEARGGYADFCAARTTGRLTPFINGRSGKTQATAADQTEAFDAMQDAVARTGKGDLIYIAAWKFNPGKIALTKGATGKSWGDLIVAKAKAGVKVRVLISDFGTLGIAHKSDLGELDKLIMKLPADRQDNFKYLVAMHPAQLSLLGPLSAYVAVHHEKFVVVRCGGTGTAFCGGLDIADQRTPVPGLGWPNPVWHDIHLMLEGRIVRDLERAFVERWNQAKDKSTAPALAGWKPLETLAVTSNSATDASGARNPHRTQMMRTVATSTAPSDIKRDDIWQAYVNLIGCASEYLYFENQYFTEPRMADLIARQAEAQPALIVIFVIPERTDDPDNALVEHIRALQHEFFKRVIAGVPPARLRIYGMRGRWVHSKLAMADDRALTAGSANANQRGFYLDTELNVIVEDRNVVRQFRQRLWSHELGIDQAAVSGWKVPSFLSEWDKVAKANLARSFDQMSGEAIIPMDPLAVKGRRTPAIPDVLGEF